MHNMLASWPNGLCGFGGTPLFMSCLIRLIKFFKYEQTSSVAKFLIITTTIGIATDYQALKVVI